MERVATSQLPEGTNEKLEQKARILGYLKKNGKPNVSAMLRWWILQNLGKN